MYFSFRFTRGFFSLRFLPFSIPYPVPFRLLGDKAKGWLDITYLSHRTMQRRSIVTEPLRISRGNKGTIFVLTRKMEPKEVRESNSNWFWFSFRRGKSAMDWLIGSDSLYSPFPLSPDSCPISRFSLMRSPTTTRTQFARRSTF